MPISVVMPALEMAQETGKLVSWLKQEGDAVVKGEPLLEVETDKAVMEIESPGNGVLAAVKVKPGDEVPVGQTIAWLLAAGEAPPSDTPVLATGRHMSHAQTTAAAAPAPVAQVPTRDLRVSPKARRVAREHGIDLNTLRGSGPGGAVLTADVLAFVESKAAGTKAAAPAPAAAMAPSPAAVALSTVARLMAERTVQSWTTVPHFFLARDVDAGRLVTLRELLLPLIENARQVRITQTDLLVAVVARVLLKHPALNASWVDSGVRHNPEINIAVAMAVEDAVVAPVIHGADKLSLGEIAGQRRDLAERARAGRLRSADISGGTFTVSNLGMYNVDAFQAIITPPQAAILAVGRIADRVVAVAGKAAVRPGMTMTLSSDHRVVDGARAAKFLDNLAAAIAEPEKSIRL